MAKLHGVFTLILLSFFLIISCGKYEEGPEFSLKSKTGRLTGQWKTIVSEGQKLTPAEQDQYFFEFDKEGGFSLNELRAVSTISLRGTWEWINKKEAVKITIQGIEPENWNILKLTNKELWFTDKDNLRWELEKK